MISKPCIPTSPHPILNKEVISDIYNFPVFSFEGKSSLFGKLVATRDSVLNVVVIFSKSSTRVLDIWEGRLTVKTLVRHFFCSCDQDYIHSIALYLTPTVLSTLPIGPSRLIIVGCGDPSRILPYAAETSCKLLIFTDPTGRIYEILQIKKSLTISRRPSYMRQSLFSLIIRSMK